jgi:hypothetical protein
MDFITAGSSSPSGWQPSTTASKSAGPDEDVAAFIKSKMLSIMYSNAT